MANSHIINTSQMNGVYLDQFMDAHDSNIWCDYGDQVGSYEDISSPNIVFTLPQTTAFKSASRNVKNGNNEKGFECPHCNSKFSNTSNLKTHLRIHSGDKPYVCEDCNVSFVQNSNLKAHMRLHTGERPYKCKECGKSFARSSHLSGHKRTHTGELPYSCELCTKSFSTNSQLKKHQEKHQDVGNYMCNICDMSFLTLDTLILHKKLHSRDRPFRCAYCMASFRSREDLSTHKKLHPGTGCPYVCSNCGRGFKIKFCCEKHYEKCINECQSKNTMLMSNSENLLDYPALTSKSKKVFLFDDGKVELLEVSIEEGIDVEEQQVVVSINDGGLNS